jgi:tRNA U55 pseudouridine synthase TruB
MTDDAIIGELPPNVENYINDTDSNITAHDLRIIFKPVGMSLFSCINRVREELGLEHDRKISYAGRLDPIACGLIPIVITPDLERRKMICESFNGCYKTYRFNVIMGLKSDSYDILGIAEHLNEYTEDLVEIQDKIFDLSLITRQEYPPFSSKTVYSERRGKKVKLVNLALEGDIPDELPDHEVDITHFTLLGYTIVEPNVIHHVITNILNTVDDPGHFRMNEVIEGWESIIHEKEQYTVLLCEAKVSSGTYIRGLANSMGGVAYNIYRTQIGNHSIASPAFMDKFKFSIL